MKVNNAHPGAVQGSKIQEKETVAARDARRAGRTDGAAASRPAEGAKTEISARAREMAKAKDAAKAAPDVREEKIAELRRRIAEGSYKVDANAVADRMVDEHVRMSGIG